MKRPNAYGESPFFSPMAGDVIRSTTSGTTRTVVSALQNDIDYVVDGKKCVCTRQSWACWCTRNKAELVTGGPGR